MFFYIVDFLYSWSTDIENELLFFMMTVLIYRYKNAYSFQLFKMTVLTNRR
jgi:hypothetical protein